MTETLIISVVVFGRGYKLVCLGCCALKASTSIVVGIFIPTSESRVVSYTCKARQSYHHENI